MTETWTTTGTTKLPRMRLCLDYANTVEWHASEHPQERLTSYRELLAWSLRAGVLTEPEMQALSRRAAARTQEADEVLGYAVGLREAVYRVFSALSHGGRTKADDLDLLNTALTNALGKLRIEPAGGGFVWAWTETPDSLDRMLWPVARSAADLLTSPDLKRVHECADSRCGWLFLDTSRNQSRRWCEMASCGNRNKARRHYERVSKGKR